MSTLHQNSRGQAVVCNYDHEAMCSCLSLNRQYALENWTDAHEGTWPETDAEWAEVELGAQMLVEAGETLCMHCEYDHELAEEV